MSKKTAHSVKVERQAGTITAGRKDRGLVTVYAKVKGLMEPGSSRRSLEQSTPIGEIAQAEWVFTWWGTEDIRAGDTLTWGSLVLVSTGKPTDDRHRIGSRIKGYRTIDLVEKATQS